MSAIAAPGDVEPGFAPAADGAVSAVALQPDGRILIGGDFTTIDGTPRLRLARLEPAGALDTTFAPAVDGPVSAIAVQPDGRIVIAGSFATVNGAPRFSLTRLNADGTLDASFNPNLFGAGNQGLTGLWIDPAGRILVCGGFITVDGLPRRTVARLHPDGTVDPTFDAGTGANGGALSMAVQDDGRILIGGFFTSVNGLPRTFVARLNTDGSVDPGFVPNFNSLPFTGPSSAYTVAVERDGSIFVTGRFYIGTSTSFGMARFSPDGASGSTSFPHTVNTIATALQTDGRILWEGGDFSNTLHRLFDTGAIDPAFEVTGSGGAPGPNSLAFAVQPDGRVVLGGQFASLDGQPRQRLARVANDPAFETLTATSASRIQWWRNGAGPETVQVSFDLSTDYGATWAPLGAATRIAGGWEKTGLTLPPSGMLRARARAVSGFYNGSTGLIELIGEYSHVPASAGALDPSFGGGGKVSTNFGSNNLEIGYSVAVQSDGKILVAGKSLGDFALLRYASTGALDTTFGIGGQVKTDFRDNDQASAITVQSDGMILVAGTASGNFALARYTAEGELDWGFRGGKVTADFGGSDEGRSVAVQADGKILVAGIARPSGSGANLFGLVRYELTGAPDVSFGNGGKVTTAFGTGLSRGYAVAVQTDGKILVSCSRDAVM